MERLLFRVAKKWVAGYSSEEAIGAASDANRHGMSAILNFLGEDTTDKTQVEIAVKEYLLMMDLMKTQGIRGCVSVKPTQLGLAVDYSMCLQNFLVLARKAEEMGQFLWIDMESVKFTENTITIYLEILKDHPMTGVAVQAYLRRSGADIIHIIEHGGKVRLVKGAYHESEEYTFATRQQVDDNYLHLLKMLADGGSFFAVATHDGKLIDKTINLNTDNCEFQMLMGIRDELKSKLVSMGLQVSEYIPYGSQWLPYSVRRIRERKRNILLLARSLVQQ